NGTQRHPRVDGPPEGKADHTPRPGIQYDGEIDKASRDGDEGQVGNPELIRTGRNQSPGEVGEDRTAVITVGGGYDPPAGAPAEPLPANDSHRPLRVPHKPTPAKRSRAPPVAVAGV